MAFHAGAPASGGHAGRRFDAGNGASFPFGAQPLISLPAPEAPRTTFLSEPQPVRVEQPTLDRDAVPAGAVQVVEALRDAGHEAWLVGGCVRDLLLGRVPKDFDVAASATPDEVKRALPRARIIGRRFRIAHVRFRRELIEVSTFRRGNVEGDVSADGVVLSDNVYGTLPEDAFRRDFTVNALYYDPVEDVLLDYTGGLMDIERRELRCVGDPALRFREDPVRILRAVRFAAKLSLSLRADIAAAIGPLAELLTAIPPARLFDEFNKLFMQGNAAAAWSLMWQYDLPEILFPLAKDEDALAQAALENTDERISADKPVTPAFLLAAICWPEFQRRVAQTATAPNAPDERLRAAHAVMDEQRLTIAFPRRLSHFVLDVWRLQSGLERRSRRNPKRLLEHPRFRAAYDFLALRSQIGETDPELTRWWTDLQAEHPVEHRPLQEAPRGGGRRRSRRRPRRGPALAESTP